MTVQLEAASPRLAVSVAGQIALPEKDADLTFTVLDTSLDPYVRLFLPQLSPYTTAVASGSMRVVGELSDIDHLLVDATVDRLDMRLFDYALRNARPIRAGARSALGARHRHAPRRTGHAARRRRRREPPRRDDQHARQRRRQPGRAAGLRLRLRSSGAASLSATLEGPLDDPVLGGTLTIKNGRIRHFALPHALENIDGAARFDSRGVTLDGLTGELGGGAVQFGGRIDKDGYLPGRLDVTMSGRDMRLRFPEGMRSLVDADLTLQGTAKAPCCPGW